MANYDRGVYEPGDEVRVFDGSEEEDDVEGSRLPLLIVLALLVLAMFAGVVWLAYTQGVARGRGETPVLTAAAGPERVAPPQGAGSTVPYQGFKIYEQPAPADDNGDAAPAPKAAEGKTPAPAPAPAPVAVAPAPVPAPAPAKTSVAEAPKAAPAAPPAKTATAAKPAAAPPAGAPPKSVAALIQQANSVPAPAPKPAAPPALKQALVPAPAATGAPRSLAPAAPVETASASKPTTPAPATGAYALQIGAYKSQAEAEAAWKTYKARHAALLNGYAEDIRQADLGEKGTWYRLRVGGLADKDVATALCDRLKADGGACILAH